MSLVFLCRRCPLICDMEVAYDFNGKCPNCRKRLETTPYCETQDLEAVERDVLFTREKIEEIRARILGARFSQNEKSLLKERSCASNEGKA